MKRWEANARYQYSRNMSVDCIARIYGREIALRVSAHQVVAVKKPAAETQGDRFRARRESMAMSRPQLAAYVGCKDWAIKHIESDIPVRLTAIEMTRLAAFYGIEPVDLAKSLSNVRLAA